MPVRRTAPMPDIHIGERGADLINYMTNHLSGFFDFISTVLTHLLRWTYLAVATLDPGAMIAIFAVIALVATRRIVLTCVLTVGLLLVWSMGMWNQMLESMAIVVVASVFSLIVGIPIGVWSAFNDLVRAIVQPVQIGRASCRERG